MMNEFKGDDISIASIATALSIGCEIFKNLIGDTLSFYRGDKEQTGPVTGREDEVAEMIAIAFYNEIKPYEIRR